ncbi:amidohydrolase [Flavobacterium sp. J372]|uniref:amidohydrolase n=1 Tax=Flavobacterium sp. J372 TaxID=2898436 RepID=UPI00215192E1|nr:amidohydrolase [Flavobacterium sp. J372]MCR5861265.1 amidohydrolase [Flavobacterium sp. J372]
MKISLIQTALAWENPVENKNHFTQLIDTIHETDLIILPEMFSTGFTMNAAAVAEPMDSETVTWMKQLSAEKNCAVTGSVVIEEDGKYYNRLLFVEPGGTIRTYDKRHLFTLAGENKTYTKGVNRTIIEYRGWKICPLVCYDLRFPVFSRNTEDYDLLLYVANWPEPRIAAWDVLLKARAIENMCYVAGVNRIGQDNNGHNYPGHSVVIDYLGHALGEAHEEEMVLTIVLRKDLLNDTREKFGFLNDRDSFNLLS